MQLQMNNEADFLRKEIQRAGANTRKRKSFIYMIAYNSVKCQITMYCFLNETITALKKKCGILIASIDNSGQTCVRDALFMI